MFKQMVDSGYFGYITEAEGITSINSSRTTKINAAIKDFKSIVRRGGNPNDYIDSVLAKHGLTQDMLTDAECRKISSAI